METRDTKSSGTRTGTRTGTGTGTGTRTGTGAGTGTSTGPGARDAAKEALAVRRVVWISFVLALVAYGFVGAFVFSAQARPTALPDWLWPVVAVVLGMGSLFVSGFLRGRNAPSSTMTPGRISGSTGALPVPEVLGWGMAEGVGIVGLMSVVLGGSVRELMLYLAAALILLVLERPSE
jgi:hypothetical protein